MSRHLAAMKLTRHGISLQGAQEFLSGEIVTGLADRRRLLQLALYVAIHAEKNQDIEVENDETHWVGHDRLAVRRTETVGQNETITVGANQIAALKQTGLSQLGAQQLLGAQPITGAEDRNILTSLLTIGVTKTPPAGGPIPIPYPNISQ